ncbi:MAG: PDZ domain-containing protein [Planctomycetes bacterium]|nr:PDZ domain-containing protein [Planctomycetota bacterium]
MRNSNRNLLFRIFIILIAIAGIWLPSCASTSAAASRPAAAPVVRHDLTPAERHEVFEAAWTTIRDKHYDKNMNGVDWNAVHERYAPRIDSIRNDDDFTNLTGDMVHELGHSHVAIMPPSEENDKEKKPDGADAAVNIGASGIQAAAIKNKVIISRVEAGSAGTKAGLRTGDEIVAIGGRRMDEMIRAIASKFKAHWEGFVPYGVAELLTDDAGAKFDLDIVRANGEAERVVLILDKPAIPPADFGHLGHIGASFEARMIDGDILYIRFTPCILTLQDQIEAALAAHRSAKACILDLRGNPGGVGAMAMSVTRLFVNVPEELGSMRMRDQEPQRFFVYPGEAPFEGPLVVLVDGATGSTSEILSAGLQYIGRARIIGTRTMGAALPSVGVELPHGWRLQTVIADYHLPNGKSVEGDGVTPDLTVELNAILLQKGRDSVLEAAVRGLPRAPRLADIRMKSAERLVNGPAGKASRPAAAMDEETVALYKKMSEAAHVTQLLSHKNMKQYATIEIMGMKGTSEIVKAAPNKTYSKTELPMVGEIIQTFDGERGWSLNPIQGIQELKGSQLAMLKRDRFDATARMGEFYKKVEIVERHPESDPPFVVVTATPNDGDGDPLKIYVRTSDYLPFKTDMTVESEMGKIHAITEIAEYKEFDGIPQPSKILIKTSGVEVSTVIERVEWDVPVDEKLFEKPAKKKAKKAPKDEKSDK